MCKILDAKMKKKLVIADIADFVKRTNFDERLKKN